MPAVSSMRCPPAQDFCGPSLRRRDFPWSNTHHVEGDLARAVNALKEATPGGLLVGSPKLSAALVQLDLVDEYRFVVHPVVAGHGPFLFSGLQPSMHLKFAGATRLKSSIVALHYRRRQSDLCTATSPMHGTLSVLIALPQRLHARQ